MNVKLIIDEASYYINGTDTLVKLDKSLIKDLFKDLQIEMEIKIKEGPTND
jgi:hypothetical protein